MASGDLLYINCMIMYSCMTVCIHVILYIASVSPGEIAAIVLVLVTLILVVITLIVIIMWYCHSKRSHYDDNRGTIFLTS